MNRKTMWARIADHLSNERRRQIIDSFAEFEFNDGVAAIVACNALGSVLLAEGLPASSFLDDEDLTYQAALNRFHKTAHPDSGAEAMAIFLKTDIPKEERIILHIDPEDRGLITPAYWLLFLEDVWNQDFKTIVEMITPVLGNE